MLISEEIKYLHNLALAILQLCLSEDISTCKPASQPASQPVENHVKYELFKLEGIRIDLETFLSLAIKSTIFYLAETSTSSKLV